MSSTSADAAAEQPERRADIRPRRRYSQTKSAVSCLARVLAAHGLSGTEIDLVQALGASASDLDVINFLDVAEKFGLTGNPTVVTLADWRTIPTLSILHWGTDSLVVLLGHDEKSVRIHDPDRGERRVGLSEFRRQFTGVVLVFAASAGRR